MEVYKELAFLCSSIYLSIGHTMRIKILFSLFYVNNKLITYSLWIEGIDKFSKNLKNQYDMVLYHILLEDKLMRSLHIG